MIRLADNFPAISSTFDFQDITRRLTSHLLTRFPDLMLRHSGYSEDRRSSDETVIGVSVWSLGDVPETGDSCAVFVSSRYITLMNFPQCHPVEEFGSIRSLLFYLENK